MLRRKRYYRSIEGLLLLIALSIGFLGFWMVMAAAQIQQGQFPTADLPQLFTPLILIGLAFASLHLILHIRRMEREQLILPIVGLLFMLGLVMIWRLRGSAIVWQQLWRGFIPGVLVMGAMILQPRWIERIRRWALPVSLVGLALPVLTAFFGVVDETGARLALKLGPLPPIQTSELLKVGLLIFLAWFIEREGVEVEGRARLVLRWLRVPAFRYFIPGILFVAMATLALVRMSDFGAVLILGCLFVAMLYAGFETRIFGTVAAIGMILALLVGLVLYFTWEVPAVIQYRFLAFRNPWSNAMIVMNGQSTGVTIAEGPGYQIQQAIYAIIAGGVTGTGLGLGSPGFIPLAASDFIFAAIVEEMGAITSIAILAFFVILILRIFRVGILLPGEQVFERLLLVGIGIHLFTQVFIMVGGTLNLIPLTGVTIPFLSQGGVALFINLVEIGMVLAIAQRLEMRTQ